MGKFEEKYPNLSYLLNAYFHQSWDFEFDSAEAAISSFTEEETNETLVGVADEISFILTLELDEVELDDLLVSSNSSYYVWRSSDIKIQNWLFLLANQLYEHVYC
ncbi:contact-dependent growth inhibition system immunity protein [Vibrio nigripulchritudo]|uniref:contact-dependent growth inhibition system immunity protein n=1 Tax=Vibrio nigripulchritudo TaxID=28173 RepID=UPI0005F9E7DD|nr:contact-dependent growth inhibition system immunity protein [Vibrio nigripulchritudo]KJY66347.1 hypothetical protein TW74_28105 [Vibrio nigripulchritudo]